MVRTKAELVKRPRLIIGGGGGNAAVPPAWLSLKGGLPTALTFEVFAVACPSRRSHLPGWPPHRRCGLREIQHSGNLGVGRPTADIG
jgi:hypothetical protein